MSVDVQTTVGIDEIGDRTIAAVLDRLTAFEDRMARLEDGVTSLREAVRSSAPDLTPLRAALDEVAHALAQGITENRRTGDRVDHVVAAVAEQGRATAGDAAALRATVTELLGAVQATHDAIVPLTRSVEAVRDDVAGIDVDLGPVLMAVNDVRGDLALGRAGVDTSGEAIRARLDDQRALTDALAANVCQLNASLLRVTEEPQQLRRDLDRLVDQVSDQLRAVVGELHAHAARTSGQLIDITP